jgi:hypothetical protein
MGARVCAHAKICGLSGAVFAHVALVARDVHSRINDQSDQVLVALEVTERGHMANAPIYIVDGEIPRRNTRPHEQT